MLDKTASLPKAIRHIVHEKGTEKPYTGEYTDFGGVGTYICRVCGLALFRSQDKFHSGCGWPSFDEEIPNTVIRKPDPIGNRTEILCARCQAHLGHVFLGEGMTAKNKRHCVNSLSLDFVSDTTVLDTEEALFAGGCFWGIEYYFKRLKGVLKTEVGYTAGHTENPSYEEVCRSRTGHVEAIRVIYDKTRIDYEKVAKYFFEIHDPTQKNGQGPDLGEQYLSVAFYYTNQQKEILENLIQQLKNKCYVVATKLLPVSVFWPAEIYHQDYYTKTSKIPYCHRYEQRF